MYRKFIATVAAASIALTAIGATAASAESRGTNQALAALLGLAVVGAIVAKNKKDKKRDHEQVTRHAPAPVYEPRQPQHIQRTHDIPRYHQPTPRPLPDRVNRKLLPSECLRVYRTNRGKVRMFGKRCLKRNYDFAHRLPRQCQYIFDTPRGDRRGYEARCLRDRGYRLARG